MTDLPFRTILGLNQQTYERLKLSLDLNLRRQVFIAVCDDLPLRDRLAMQLQSELGYFSPDLKRAGQTPAEPRQIPRLVTLELDLNDPNPIAQVNQWLRHFPVVQTKRQATVPAFQILGIEHLTRQSAALQSTFLAYLQTIEPHLSAMESSLVLWMTQPWFRMLPEAAPDFWYCRTGIFEFVGDPTPLPTTSPERILLKPSAPSTGLDASVRTVESARTVELVRTVEIEQSIETAGNPWLPLADELPWDEANQPQTSGDLEATGMPLQLESWLTAFNQQLEVLNAGSSQQFEPSVSTALRLTPAPDASSVATSDAAQLLSAQHQAVKAAIEGLSADLEANLASDLEQAIPVLQHVELLQQQIALLQQGQESPLFLATAYRTLGNFYRDCIEQGDASAENLAIAIQTYEQALQWLPDTAPEQPEILNDLGNLYWMTAQLQRDPAAAATCLQQTVHSYQQALSRLQPEAHAALYGMVQSNLGAAYADLARYQEPAANLEQSAIAYQQALQCRPRAKEDLHYASTQNNLGTTYWNLAQYQQPELNLNQAIAAYAEALHYYSPEQEPLTYAMIQNNLGTAYWNLAQYGAAADYLTAAVSAYQIALQYRTFESAPTSFAATQNNLGTAYWHLANHTDVAEVRSTYLQQAIEAYGLALVAADYLQAKAEAPTGLNFDLAATQNNLGLAHYQLAIDPHIEPELSPGDTNSGRIQHLETALHYHLAALQQWEQTPSLRQTALSCVVQTVRAFYTQQGLTGQNQALSRIPSQLLPEILPKL